MSASVAKTVKVDNWGIYFLQRLKHFFNRTDYCDLTLQFQDNAQLKVHRLVLSACTEYFEILERTCEMYEDCLVMPDDLQADVVVPIVNFMYTGQLEFKMDILDRLHACSEIMNMPVLSKLLDSHRQKPKPSFSYSYSKRGPKPQIVQTQAQTFKITSVEDPVAQTSEVQVTKQPVTKVVEKTNVQKKFALKTSKSLPPVLLTNGGRRYRSPSPSHSSENYKRFKPAKVKVSGEPRPTRYELPEELDQDNLFESSFTHISYTSQPLMVHPETTKYYSKRPRQDKALPSTSKRSRPNTLDIVECKKVAKDPGDPLFEETSSIMETDDDEMFRSFDQVQVKTEPIKDTNKLFDQLLDQEEEQQPKVTIETTKKVVANLDHAKIISDVLKKYPHLVKSNKNIKLKIFNNPLPTRANNKKHKPSQNFTSNNSEVKAENVSDYTYETDVIDSKQAAKLIALGAENIEGPWICLICGTPGKALHFSSYYKFRRHLVEVHNEKPVQNICEFCGQKMSKRNHLLHHLYAKHGVEPPQTHRFPKCHQCSYIALNEALLVKHKLSHSEAKSFRCNVCPSTFNSSKLLLVHIQNTGHKYIADRKSNHQCIYCLRVFVRENNLYAHLKTHHKADAIKDGIIDESDEEDRDTIQVKNEPVVNEYEDNMEYHIQQNPNGNIQLIPKKQAEKSPSKQTILNTSLPSNEPSMLVSKPRFTKSTLNVQPVKSETTFSHGNGEEIILIDNNEYVMSGNRLILKKTVSEPADEFILSDLPQEKSDSSPQAISTVTSIDYNSMINTNENLQQASITGNMGESIPIFVSNEEEYKALIASNHNIIFDSTDKNKTLTVLTTSEAGSINNPGIDLDNSQNSDMMIIQDNYPLNVSEAVVTDNPNIVVVYSQQVGDPNKGYQILTTQAIDSQYAQTSGIMTHNYETISTACPVTTTQILETPISTWPAEIHGSINSHPTNTSAILQSIVNTGVIQVTHVEESIDNLPQVEMTSVHNQPAIISQIQESHHIEPSENMETLPEPELVQCAQIIPMDEDDQLATATTENEIISVQSDNDVHEESEVVENIETAGNLNEIETQEIDQIPESEIISEVETEVVRMETPISGASENSADIDIPDPANDDHIVCLDVQTSISHENVLTTEMQTSDTAVTQSDEQIAEIDEHIENDEVHDTEGIIDAGCVIENQTTEDNVGPDAVQEIQTLASEWSEEDDSQSQGAIDSNDQESTNPETEVEESIENIQQEITKQSADSIADEDEPGNDETDPSEELPSVEAIESSESIDPKVKLSSLLNDWDDNDSQEDNVTEKNVAPGLVLDSHVTETNTKDQELTPDDTLESLESQENSVEEDILLVNVPITEAEPTESSTEPAIKQDKIKTLVSDWDDEDEEEKD